MDSELSDYEVIYEYVESTYIHRDAHDMTGVKKSIEADAANIQKQ